MQFQDFRRDGRFSRSILIWHGGSNWSAHSTPDHMVKVIIGYGKRADGLPEGAMPVFTVNTEEEAKSLIVLACPVNYEGEYYSRELAQELTIENLGAFSDKMAYCWEVMKKQ